MNQEAATMTLMDEEMWEAVASKDPKYDDSFVFAVRSTNVYCVASCPSRRPNRRNVVFFAEPAQAEAAHYRPCMRCRPNIPNSEKRNTMVERSGTHVSENQSQMVEDVCRLIDESGEAKLGLQMLSSKVGMSPFHLQRVFKKALGVSPREYAEATKIERAKLLMRGGESVRKSIYSTGHNSTSWLYSGTGRLGMRPSEYRKGGEGMEIHFSLSDTPLGKLLVGGTRAGICSVSLGDSDERLEALLRDEYPNAVIKRDEKTIYGWVERIVEYLTSDRKVSLERLPLDIIATSFQIRVWKALQKIPYGSTLSYSEVASKISEPRAVRAVANACATNPVPLVVPCHRVIRNDGSLGGYRLGLERKRTLLEHERKNLPP